MTQRDNILQELNQLQSSLVNAGTQNVYRVPGGSFDSLAEQVLNRIKALDTENAHEELHYLSPLLNSISKKMPYAVPANFFDGLAASVIASAKNEHKTPAEELEELSPLLSGLKKEMPFSVPQDYFEKLNSTIATKEVKPLAKVVSITRQKWFRYAVAAVVIGLVAVGGYLYTNKNEPASTTEPGSIVKKMMKKVSTDEINSFVQLADEEIRDVAVVDSKTEVKDKNEIQELIKDIPEKDIQNFLDETQANEPDNTDDALMN